MTLAAGGEVGSLFHNYKSDEIIRVTIEEMGHPQYANPMHTDNSTAEGIASNYIQKKSTNAMGMQFYWVQEQDHQGNYNVFCKLGATNLSNYSNKHYRPHHHRRKRPVYLHCQDNSNHSITRVFNSSHNSSLKEILNQDSNKEIHL